MQDHSVTNCPPTYEDLCAVPAHLTAEILFGTLVTHPQPVARHRKASHRLVTLISPRYEYEDGINGPGGWIFMFEPFDAVSLDAAMIWKSLGPRDEADPTHPPPPAES